MAARPAKIAEKLTAGKERDAESGLDYFGARYYGSALLRFTSPDPDRHCFDVMCLVASLTSPPVQKYMATHSQTIERVEKVAVVGVQGGTTTAVSRTMDILSGLTGRDTSGEKGLAAASTLPANLRPWRLATSRLAVRPQR